MYYIFFFDAAPIIFCVLLIICALFDKVASALPIMCGIFWVLFAVFSLFIFALTIATKERKIIQKIIVITIMIISLVMMASYSNDFFIELEDSYGDGGFNGIFGFIVTILFGGCIWLMVLCGLTYAFCGPLFAESNSKFILNSVLGVGILVIAKMFFL